MGQDGFETEEIKTFLLKKPERDRNIKQVESMWPHLKEVNYNGVYWRDIDWDLPMHCPSYCDHCGGDAMEGHQNACGYLFKNQTTPAGMAFLKHSIARALIRHGIAAIREENLNND